MPPGSSGSPDTGYREDDASAAFLPGYPLAIRAVAWVVRDELLAALLVSNGAFLAALIVLHALTEEEYDRPMARRSVVLLAAFPTSFFFLAPYSESLFLLLTLVSPPRRATERMATAGVSARGRGDDALRRARAAPRARRRGLGAQDHAGARRSPGSSRRRASRRAPLLYAAYWAAPGNVRAPIDAQAAVGQTPRRAARPPRAGDDASAIRGLFVPDRSPRDGRRCS